MTRARIVLLAAGGESRPGEAIGLRRPPVHMAPALEVEGRARSCALDPRALLFDYDVPGGYAWAFPKRELWNVGVVTTQSHPGAALRGHLQRVITAWGIEYSDATVHAAGRRIPMWRRRTVLHAGRAALLGDSAALADPFFGEGIAGALLSGRLAAAATAEVLAGREDDLATYSAAVVEATRAHMRRAQRVAGLVYPRPRPAMWCLRRVRPVRRHAAALAVEPFAASRY